MISFQSQEWEKNQFEAGHFLAGKTRLPGFLGSYLLIHDSIFYEIPHTEKLYTALGHELCECWLKDELAVAFDDGALWQSGTRGD